MEARAPPQRTLSSRGGSGVLESVRCAVVTCVGDGARTGSPRSPVLAGLLLSRLCTGVFLIVWCVQFLFHAPCVIYFRRTRARGPVTQRVHTTQSFGFGIWRPRHGVGPDPQLPAPRATALRERRQTGARQRSGRDWWRHRCGCCLSFPLVAAGRQGALADFGAGWPRDGCRVRLHPLAYQVPPLCCLAKLPLVLNRRVPPAFVRLIRRRAQVALVAAAVVAWDACGWLQACTHRAAAWMRVVAGRTSCRRRGRLWGRRPLPRGPPAPWRRCGCRRRGTGSRRSVRAGT